VGQDPGFLSLWWTATGRDLYGVQITGYREVLFVEDFCFDYVDDGICVSDAGRGQAWAWRYGDAAGYESRCGPVLTVASVFSVIRNASVPYGITTPDQPNISSTRWRTVSDQKRKIYFFESAVTPNIFWVYFKDIDFSAETGKVMKLDLGKDQSHVYAGDAVKDFQVAKPFRFLGLR
jgi:hypothetical protein